jgi:integrase
MAGKRGNGESTIYLGSDGSWHGRVTIGTKDNGRADRRHVRGTTKAAVTKKVRALEESRRTGTVQEVGQRWTVGQWLDHWLENIARPSVRENSYLGYRVDVNVHLKPAIGGQKLTNLGPEQLERLYVAMQQKGKAPATAHHVHRTVRTALGEAERRGYVTRNVAALVKPPRIEEHEVDPLTVDQVQRLLKVVADRRNSVRWAIALSLGLRQGEALGLKWADIDLDMGSLAVRRSRLRPRWAHGCGGTCDRPHGGYCPDRVPLRKDAAETKSSAGRRVIGLPDELIRLLRIHQGRQSAERELAADLWTEGDWVFANATGQPVNPRTDYTEWKAILEAAGLPDTPLHGARHTAATVLLLLGVPDRAVMSLMGWSKAEMLARYQHLTTTIRADIASRVGALLWDE